MIVGEMPGRRLDALGSRQERLAFWINTYNALVAQGIAALNIRESVWEAPDFFARVSFRIGRFVFSADDIEHGVLRGNRPNPLSGTAPFNAGDPRLAHAIVPLELRIHFTISCGAHSCPTVHTYHAPRLEEELEAATRAFVNREIVIEGDRLTLSPIFNWFRADFDEFPSGLVGFLARYLDPGLARGVFLEHGLSNATWRPYDWRLQTPVLLDERGGEWIARD